MMHHLRHILRIWVPLAVAVTGLAGLVYGAVQQDLRQNANDPQIQIAEDTAAALSGGATVESQLPAGIVPMESSLAPFVMIFDADGNLAASSALLHGAAPALPDGVLAYTFAHADDRVTWQPAAGVRIAAVVVHYAGSGGGYVLAGRSLREVEIREDNLFTIAALAWAVTLAASLVVLLLLEWILPRGKPSA
jgi:hypothetical protein